MKLDEDVADWLFDTVAWWIREIGPVEGVRLARPIPADFPGATPEALLDAVIELVGLQEWSFELVDESDMVLADPMANARRPAAPGAVLVPESEPERVEDGAPFPIPYTHEDAADPLSMVARIARGVSHYVLQSADEEHPDGDDHHEARVEVGAVLLGLGVFIANTAFRFQQFDDGWLHGWRSAAQGELGEDALGYALALFVELAGADERAALAYLTTNPRSAFQWARRQLAGPRAGDVAALRAIVSVAAADGPYR